MKAINRQLTELARKLRKDMTPAEKLLWQNLRSRRFAGFKFRRQHPLEPYIVDFYCEACKLIIELDGESHLTKQEQDSRRISSLEDRGYLVLHFWNNVVYDDLEAVLERVYQECQKRFNPSPPTPLPGGEGRYDPSPPTPLPGGEGRTRPSPPTPLPGGEGRTRPSPPTPLPG